MILISLPTGVGYAPEVACKGPRIGLSLYYFHIVRWLNILPRDHILFLRTEDFLTDPYTAMKQVQLKQFNYIIPENLVLLESCVGTQVSLSFGLPNGMVALQFRIDKRTEFSGKAYLLCLIIMCDPALINCRCITSWGFPLLVRGTA